MVELKKIYDAVKTDFCDLLDYKVRGNTLEILTGIPTLNQSSISVFVSWDGTKFIASDGGWIDIDEYDVINNYENGLIDQISDQYIKYFDVKSVFNGSGQQYFYKTCSDLALVSSIVHDMGHFIAMIVNLHAINFEDKSKDAIETKRFQSTISNNLRKFYGSKNVRTNHILSVRNDQRIRLNAMVSTRRKQSIVYNCLMYITGTRPDIIIKDLARATVNFKVIEESSLIGLNYQRLAIINTSAPGYQPSKIGVYTEELAAYSDQKLILANDSNLYNVISEVMPLVIDN